MVRTVVASFVTAGAIVLAGCGGTGHGGSGSQTTTAPTSHTAADALACADVDLFSTDPASVTPAKAQTLVTHSLAADNPDLRREGQSLQAALHAKNGVDAQDAIDAMIRTCTSLGVGPKK